MRSVQGWEPMQTKCWGREVGSAILEFLLELYKSSKMDMTDTPCIDITRILSVLRVKALLFFLYINLTNWELKFH